MVGVQGIQGWWGHGVGGGVNGVVGSRGIQGLGSRGAADPRLLDQLETFAILHEYLRNPMCFWPPLDGQIVTQYWFGPSVLGVCCGWVGDRSRSKLQ